jgi:murein DD-endopeptidase MepM/ murein hydrolase activator NlpD
VRLTAPGCRPLAVLVLWAVGLALVPGMPAPAAESKPNAKHPQPAGQAHDNRRHHGRTKAAGATSASRRAAAKPMAKPEGDTVADHGVAEFRRGCALAADRQDDFLAQIGVRDSELGGVLARDLPAGLGSQGDCLPYVAALEASGRVRAFGVLVPDPGGSRQLFLYARDEAGGPMRAENENLAAEADFNTYTAPLADVLGRSPALYAALPAEVLPPLTSITPMMSGVGEAANSAQYVVRIGYSAGLRGRPPRLLSVQLVEDRTGAVQGEALWVERHGLPGGFFAPDGRSFEHALWTAPVSFTRISRGVGAYQTSVLRKVKRRVGHQVRIVRARTTHAGTHVGVDYAAPLGTPVIAVADGRIVELGWHGGYGNLIVVEHAGGYTTRYAHLSAYASDLAVGDEVRRGREIGFVGSTGRSTGPHLHFEIRLDGVYLDPLDDRLAFGLWSMRSADYMAMLRQTLIAEALASDTEPTAQLLEPAESADAAANLRRLASAPLGGVLRAPDLP